MHVPSTQQKLEEAPMQISRVCSLHSYLLSALLCNLQPPQLPWLWSWLPPFSSYFSLFSCNQEVPQQARLIVEITLFSEIMVLHYRCSVFEDNFFFFFFGISSSFLTMFGGWKLYYLLISDTHNFPLAWFFIKNIRSIFLKILFVFNVMLNV